MVVYGGAADPLLYKRFILTLDCFNILASSKEDKNRTKLYTEEKQRAEKGVARRGAGACGPKADGHALGGSRAEPGFTGRRDGGRRDYHPSIGGAPLPRRGEAGILFRRLRRRFGHRPFDRVGSEIGQPETAGGLPDRRRLVQLRSGPRRVRRCPGA